MEEYVVFAIVCMFSLHWTLVCWPQEVPSDFVTAIDFLQTIGQMVMIGPNAL